MKKYGPVVFRLRLLASLQKIEIRNKLDKLNLHPGQPMILNAIHNNPDKDFKGSVLASDAFFPFNDCVQVAANAGVAAIIQPGGSIKDQDSIDACNKHGIAMVFTKVRHFKH